jgi:hypothetical protein
MKTRTARKYKKGVVKRRMGPTRRKQRGGGKLSMIPFDGLSSDTLKIVDEGKLLADVRETHFYLLGAHGVTMMGKQKFQEAVVPPNTYLIFNGPAGCITYDLYPYTKLFVEKEGEPSLTLTGKPFAEGIVDNIKQSLKRIEKIESGTFTGPDPDFPFKTLAPKERETLGECEATCYPTEFNKYARSNRTTKSACIESSKYTAKTIYGPGEHYIDLKVGFENRPSGIILLGAYQLPIQSELNHALYSAKLSETTERMSPDAMAAFDEATFTEEAGNMIESLLHKRDLLSNVLSAIPFPEDGKKRVIFITACRGICESSGSSYVTSQYARAARRGSIHGTIGEIKKMNIDTFHYAYNLDRRIYEDLNQIGKLKTILKQLKKLGSHSEEKETEIIGEFRMYVYELIEKKGKLTPAELKSITDMTIPTSPLPAYDFVKGVYEILWRKFIDLAAAQRSYIKLKPKIEEIIPRGESVNSYVRKTNPHIATDAEKQYELKENEKEIVSILGALLDRYDSIKNDRDKLRVFKATTIDRTLATLKDGRAIAQFKKYIKDIEDDSNIPSNVNTSSNENTSNENTSNENIAPVNTRPVTKRGEPAGAGAGAGAGFVMPSNW